MTQRQMEMQRSKIMQECLLIYGAMKGACDEGIKALEAGQQFEKNLQKESEAKDE